MGDYFMNMNLALMGLPLDGRATAEGFEIAERLGFTELRIYHLFSQIVRASFTGDGAAYAGPFAEMNELIRKLGNPRLPERNLMIYTPPYYLERGELEQAGAVIERAARFRALLPGDRWLGLYVDVYGACLGVLQLEARAAAVSATAVDAALSRALVAARENDFRMETLVLVYRSRFERARAKAPGARAAALAALTRAIDPVGGNPFDELLARRASADLEEGAAADAHLARAAELAAATGNVLQAGLVALAQSDRAERAGDAGGAEAHLAAAEAAFAAARAEVWLRRCRERHGN